MEMKKLTVWKSFFLILIYPTPSLSGEGLPLSVKDNRYIQMNVRRREFFFFLKLAVIVIVQ